MRRNRPRIGVSARSAISSLAAMALLVGGANAAASPVAQPTFTDLAPAQERRFLNRVEEAPNPLRHLIERSYPALRVRSYDGKLGGGNFTATLIDADGTRFVVGLSPQSLEPGVAGRHTTMHELGHVVINASFRRRDYSGMLQLLSSSPAWKDCFPSAPRAFEPCVSPDEILAEQLAFLTSPSSFRSSYRIPPLAPREQLLALLRSIL